MLAVKGPVAEDSCRRRLLEPRCAEEAGAVKPQGGFGPAALGPEVACFILGYLLGFLFFLPRPWGLGLLASSFSWGLPMFPPSAVDIASPAPAFLAAAEASAWTVPLTTVDKTDKQREVLSFLARVISCFLEAPLGFCFHSCKLESLQLSLASSLRPLCNQEGRGQLEVSGHLLDSGSLALPPAGSPALTFHARQTSLFVVLEHTVPTLLVLVQACPLI